MTADRGPRVHGATSCNGTFIIPGALLPENGGTVNLTYPVDALVSYHYYQRDDLMGAVTRPGHLRLIGDSGAYSAYAQGKTIKLAEYAAWCLRWRDQLAWVAALDVIGDPDATYRNWAIFRDQHGICSIPTLHAGGDPARLDVYAAEGVDFIGLGGLVGVANRATGWLVQVLRYARDHHPAMRFHLWGVTTRKILDVLPVYSTDSSGIMGQGYRYARLRIFDPATHRDVQMALNGRDVFKHSALLRRTYGVTPADIATSSPANRALLIQLAAASTQQYAAWLQTRHHVPAPTWGIRDSSDGTRIALVDAAAGHGTETDLATLGPRVHQVVNRASHTGPLQPAPDGPRVHVGGNRAAAGNDDLATLGPRLHLTDGSQGAGSANKMAALQPGPRVHVTDSNPNYLKGLQ